MAESMTDTSGLISLGITAASGLLGTLIGGLVGYWSSSKMHDRTIATEESRQRHALLRDNVEFANRSRDPPAPAAAAGAQLAPPAPP